MALEGSRRERTRHAAQLPDLSGHGALRFRRARQSGFAIKTKSEKSRALRVPCFCASNAQGNRITSPCIAQFSLLSIIILDIWIGKYSNPSGPYRDGIWRICVDFHLKTQNALLLHAENARHPSGSHSPERFAKLWTASTGLSKRAVESNERGIGGGITATAAGCVMRATARVPKLRRPPVTQVSAG